LISLFNLGFYFISNGGTEILHLSIEDERKSYGFGFWTTGEWFFIFGWTNHLKGFYSEDFRSFFFYHIMKLINKVSSAHL